MKHSFLFLIVSLSLWGCKSDSQKQREQQLETYEKLYQTERAKMDPKEFEPRLDTTTYKILERKQAPHKLTIIYVLIKNYPISKDSMQIFMDDFRHDQCANNTNVYVIDNNEIFPLIKKSPLSKEEYLLVADYFVAASFFSEPEYVWFYPYQDFKYKKLGGKNWKKEPIK